MIKEHNEFDFDRDFNILRNHILLLSTEWSFYEDLYGSNLSISTLNKSASYFFSRLQMIFIDSIIMKISKLLENRITGRNNHNLTLDYLLNNIDVQTIDKKKIIYNIVDFLEQGILVTKNEYFFIHTSSLHLTKVRYWSDVKPTLNNQREKILKDFLELKDYRDKNMAHIDLETAQENKTYLPKNLYKIIPFIIESLGILMNQIESHIKDISTEYNTIISYKGVSHLMNDILKSLRYDELIKNGIIESTDFVRNMDRIRRESNEQTI